MNIYKFNSIKVFLFICLFAVGYTSNAQILEEDELSNYQGLFEEDTYSEKKYKRTYTEEELYNGRYRNKSYSQSNGYSSNSVFGLGNISKKKESNSSKYDVQVPDEKPIKKKFNRLEGTEGGIGNNEDNDVTTALDNIKSYIFPDKEKHRPADEDPFIKGPPEPPLDPELPIDSAVVFLFIGGLLIGYFKFKATYKTQATKA